MDEFAATHRVDVTFVGTAPAARIERASGVTEVRVDGRTVRCLVRGSFQPFLEAVRGYEVTSLTAIPVADEADAGRRRTEEPMTET
jgi:hypothetical protein